MQRKPLLTATLFALALAFAAAASAQPVKGYYRFPAIYGDTVVFTAEGDLWRVGVQGGVAQRRTTHLAEETNAAISLDGRWPPPYPDKSFKQPQGRDRVPAPLKD